MKYGKSKGKAPPAKKMKAAAKMTAAAPADDTSSADTMQAIDKAAVKARSKRLAGYQL